MSLRSRLSLMLSAFLLALAVLAGGTIIIFEKMSDHMSTLRAVSEESRLFNELENNMTAFLKAVTNWGLTGEVRYRKEYRERLSAIYKSFGDVSSIRKRQSEIDAIGKEFELLLGYASFVIEKRDPVGTAVVDNYLMEIDERGKGILARIDGLQEYSIDAAMNIAGSAQKIRDNLVYYHAALIAFSGLISIYLVLRIRHAIAVPVNELLKATGRISAGDLSYRMGADRRDEFGIVAERFNGMVEDLDASKRKLERKLAETELLLAVARIAGTTLDLKDALRFIVETVAAKLRYDSCSVYMLSPDGKSFCLEASSRSGAEKACLPFSDPTVAEMVNTLRPSYLERGLLNAEHREREGLPLGFAMPLARNGSCYGLFVLAKGTTNRISDDEMNALRILGHTIDAVVRNAELFRSTKSQLDKLTALYEMSKALTSVLDLGELLKRIAEEITRLVSSKGCIIRLLENDRLRIKSYFGLPDGIDQAMEVSIGEGIAGWVAEKGEPLLVENVENMPSNLRVPVLNVKSVICVPLKVKEEVIGTLGLYDKFDAEGEIIPFSSDDLNTVQGFASISAIAIEKSKAFELEVERKKKSMEEKKRLNVLFDSVQGGIITLDREYGITSVNRYIEDWINLPADAIIGKSALEVFHDKIGICPHCAAKVTFETGEINSIMQSRGVNYAELTAYPIRSEKGDVAESVVFIMDITERVLYQEETLSLYREVIQTKEYLESIIGNSADAIVTSDLEGIITSWNEGAEKIFGFSEKEVAGRFLPFIPEFLMEKERENMERIRLGEVLKDVETLRMRKDGTIIEVSLALSPIKDAAGEVIGISGISRDISEKKRVEKELIRRNQEMSRLFFISSALRSVLDLDRLLRMVLTAVTMSDGMGFNRAILFFVDEQRNVLRGKMGVGPANPEEAWRIWDDLSHRHRTLDDIMQEIATTPIRKDSFLERVAEGIEIPLDAETALSLAVREKRSFNIRDARIDTLSDAVLIQQLGTEAYAVVPLVSRDRVIGLIWVDNFFNRKPVTDEDMQFLASFSNHLASAIENARLFEQVTMAEQQLENIFESMSDMVYFNSKDYEIRSINKAVSNKLGLRPSEIIGRKCYEVFHGMNEPYRKCPHHKTVMTKKAYVEELEDPHLGGTFLTSSSPIFDSTGEFIGSVHVVRDITELRNLREKLVMAEKMAALGEVAAKVAHEIRNPLVSVGGFAKRLENKLEGNLKEYAGIIVREVTRLESILKEILGFVKEVRLTRETVSPNALAEDVIRLMQSEMEERGVFLRKELGELPDIFVDPNRMKEAVVNIMTNAIQALSGRGTITVRTYAAGEHAVIEVEDTGRGIPETERPFIFNPFFTTKQSGTGLGLSITHRIVQEHGGRIEVQSEADKGSIFRIFLPIKEEET